MRHRRYSKLDEVLSALQGAIKTVSGRVALQSSRPSPAELEEECPLTEEERKLSEALLRVDNAGEYAAQGLYHGHALVARDPVIKAHMHRSAQEENDHLAWCQHRLEELGGRKSYLDPFWYGGAFAIGVMAGFLGDKWSLGFVSETEDQVVEHLQTHLDYLSGNDQKTRAILNQMQFDEAEHAEAAMHQGAAELPEFIKFVMRCASKIMTKTAFYV